VIDDIFQAGTDQAIRDRLQRPVVGPVAQPGAFANFWQAFKAPAAAGLEVAAAKEDQAFGFGQVLAAGSTMSGGGMFATQTPIEKAQSDAARDKLMHQGLDLNSPEGDALRVQAKEFMPDPATSGTATRVVAGLLNFAPQAVAATAGGPGGLVGLATTTGLNEADALRLQGVDEATRAKAGAVAGLAAAGSLVLPMGGASPGIRFLKGVAGGEATMAGQAELEHQILAHAGYDKQAAGYDPLDPVSLAVGAVPGVLGAVLGHGGAVPVKNEAQMRAAVELSPAEQAHSDAVEGSDYNLRQLDEAIATTKDPAALADLKKLREQAQALHDTARGAATDPNIEAAARVRQTAAALDESRLTPDTDLAGIDQHQQAVEMAADQLARGVPVDVSPAFGDTMLDSMRESRLLEDRVDFLEGQRAQLLGDAGNLLAPGDVADLRRQVAQLQSQLVDAGPAAVKARAAEIQGKDVSYKQASAQAQRELSGQLADQQAQIQRLQDQLQQHAAAAQATEKLSFVERDLAAARERAAALPGPRTSPRRLALAMANAFSEMRAAREPAAPLTEEPVTQPRAQAFDEARAAAQGEGGSAPAGGEGVARETPGAGAPPREPAGSSRGAARAPGEAAGPAPEHLANAEAQIARLDPDMLVQLDGMAEPMRLADLMAAVREDAARDTRDAPLLEVAAQCALSLPALR
jgi:hypothetical protein